MIDFFNFCYAFYLFHKCLARAYLMLSQGNQTEQDP